jgi:adenylosuccinate lyase
MPSHPIDFEIQPDSYSTPELRALYEERARIGRWLRFEAALAQAQAEFGVIPKESAARIAERAQYELLNEEALRADYKTTRNNILPALKAFRTSCGTGHGDYVHHGATTQDAIDTGEVLALKEAVAIMLRELRAIEDRLVTLTEEHRNTPMIGRSHGQQAIPITLGLKFAVWLAEVRRHIERLGRLHRTAFFGQLGGAVGTMAALSDHALDIKRRVMEKLELQYSAAAWHTSRDNVAEVCAAMALATVGAAKIANEVFELGRTEIGEMQEPAGKAKAMSSSTMPHKRNPVLCERVVALSAHVRGLLSIVMEATLHANERDARALWAEWLALPQFAIYSGAAVAFTREIVQGLELFPARMLANLRLHGDLVASELLLFRLAGRMGKAEAQKVLHQAGQVAAETNRGLVDVLLADPRLAGILTEEDSSSAKAPERYVGLASAIIDEVLTDVRGARAAN